MCKGREIDVREKHLSVASHTPPTENLTHNLGMYPDWNRTVDLSVCGTMPNPLSYTSQGFSSLFNRGVA